MSTGDAIYALGVLALAGFVFYVTNSAHSFWILAALLIIV